jgi:hypothetical protein
MLSGTGGDQLDQQAYDIQAVYTLIKSIIAQTP